MKYAVTSDAPRGVVIIGGTMAQAMHAAERIISELGLTERPRLGGAMDAERLLMGLGQATIYLVGTWRREQKGGRVLQLIETCKARHCEVIERD